MPARLQPTSEHVTMRKYDLSLMRGGREREGERKRKNESERYTERATEYVMENKMRKR